MNATTKRYLVDAVERIAFTAVSAASGEGVVHFCHLPQQYVIPVAAGVTAVKALVAKKVGNPTTAAALPAGTDIAVVQAGAFDAAQLQLDALQRLIRHEVEGMTPVPPTDAPPENADSPQRPAVDPAAAKYDATFVINPGV